MIRCKILLCAQGVVRDAESGSISIYNVMEGISAPGFPVFVQHLDVFALLERAAEDPGTFPCDLRIFHGTTQIIASQIGIDFQDKLRSRSIAHIQGLVIATPGTLRAEIGLDGNVLGSYEVVFEQMGQPQVQAQPSTPA